MQVAVPDMGDPSVIDPVSGAQHRVLAQPVGDSQAGGEVVVVGLKGGALRDSPLTSQQESGPGRVGVQIQIGIPVLGFKPGSHILVAQAQIQGQPVRGLEVVLKVGRIEAPSLVAVGDVGDLGGTGDSQQQIRQRIPEFSGGGLAGEVAVEGKHPLSLEDLHVGGLDEGKVDPHLQTVLPLDPGQVVCDLPGLGIGDMRRAGLSPQVAVPGNAEDRQARQRRRSPQPDLGVEILIDGGGTLRQQAVVAQLEIVEQGRGEDVVVGEDERAAEILEGGGVAPPSKRRRREGSLSQMLEIEETEPPVQSVVFVEGVVDAHIELVGVMLSAGIRQIK